MQPQMALRNTAGVILPLIAGYALGCRAAAWPWPAAH